MLEAKKGSADGAIIGLGVKEGAAKAVLRDAWQHGHESVELRRDGRRVIFFCTLCSTRCYSDAALSDHLKGNQHSRRALAAAGSAYEGSPSSALQISAQGSRNAGETEQLANGKGKDHSTLGLEPNSFPASSLEWMGFGQLLLREISSEPSRQVKAVWCRWLGRSSAEVVDVQTSEVAEESAYAVVIFPYSDAIGRSGHWKPVYMIDNNSTSSGEKPLQLEFWKKKTKSLELPSRIAVQPFCKDCVSTGLSGDYYTQKEAEQGKLSLPKDLSHRALRKELKKQRLNALERLCFICHQQMLPGKDVAALLNLKTGQMMCSSRNLRGAFHVFHTTCLVDWILLCEAKFWIAPSVSCKTDTRRMRGQISGKQQRGGSKATAGSNGPMFCPECQGTGAKFHGAQLEQPRYRLAQVFEWILELIQARRAWMDHPEQWQKSSTGLLLSSDSDPEGKVLPLGFLQFYAAGSLDFLAATALMRKPVTS